MVRDGLTMAKDGPRALELSLPVFAKLFEGHPALQVGKGGTYSRIWTPFLESGRGDAMALQLLVERTTRHAEAFCCSFDAALFFSQHGFDVLPFDFVQGQI